MTKFILLLLISYISCHSQNSESIYSYGHNGMELVYVKNGETIIINTFDAKISIRENIAEKLLELYNNNALITNTTITVSGNEADVTGKLVIEKKEKLSSINFYFEKVEWKSGLTEVFKQP